MKIVQYIHHSEATFLGFGIPIRNLRDAVPEILSVKLPDSAKETDEITKLFRSKVEQNLEWLENELPEESHGEIYLVGGNYTVADLMMGQALDLLERRLMVEGEPPLLLKSKTVNWLDNLRKRAAWVRAKQSRF